MVRTLACLDFPRMIAKNRAGNVTEKARMSRGARRWPSAAPAQINMWPMFPFPAPRGVTRGLGGRGGHRQSTRRLRRGDAPRCDTRPTWPPTKRAECAARHAAATQPLNLLTSVQSRIYTFLDTNTFGPLEIELNTN